MGKIRFYCDYCDRSFLDDLQSRKKHLTGALHNRLRNQYYRQFRSPREKYEEERQKDPCRKFLKFNDCSFGDNCKFCHLGPQELEQLRLQAEEEESRASQSVSPAMVQEELKKMPSEDAVKSWLKMWEAKRQSDASVASKPALKVVTQALLSWELPEELQGYPDLPPSLQPWEITDFDNIELEDWG